MYERPPGATGRKSIEFSGRESSVFNGLQRIFRATAGLGPSFATVRLDGSHAWGTSLILRHFKDLPEVSTAKLDFATTAAIEPAGGGWSPCASGEIPSGSSDATVLR
jgi:hypothetical protein